MTNGLINKTTNGLIKQNNKCSYKKQQQNDKCSDDNTKDKDDKLAYSVTVIEEQCMTVMWCCV